MHDEPSAPPPLLAERYAIVRRIGRGGMATVYLARDRKHDRDVAVKVLHPELAQSLGAERFLREINIAAQLTHPHILPLHDSGEAAGLLYFVMPFVVGESLRDRLTREKQLPVEDALRITCQVASALDYAHRHNVLHRDIKPENILLEDGHAVLSDFGIARAIGSAAEGRLTSTGLTLGTPAYMSPEQAAGEQTLDGRSDLYSLASVLHEMLAGEPPFTGPTAQAMIAKRLSGPPPRIRAARPSVSATVEEALLRGLDPVPADRYSTVEQFRVALAACSQESGDNGDAGKFWWACQGLRGYVAYCYSGTGKGWWGEIDANTATVLTIGAYSAAPNTVLDTTSKIYIGTIVSRAKTKEYLALPDGTKSAPPQLYVRFRKNTGTVTVRHFNNQSGTKTKPDQTIDTNQNDGIAQVPTGIKGGQMHQWEFEHAELDKTFEITGIAFEGDLIGKGYEL